MPRRQGSETARESRGRSAVTEPLCASVSPSAAQGSRESPTRRKPHSNTATWILPWMLKGPDNRRENMQRVFTSAVHKPKLGQCREISLQGGLQNL